MGDSKWKQLVVCSAFGVREENHIQRVLLLIETSFHPRADHSSRNQEQEPLFGSGRVELTCRCHRPRGHPLVSSLHTRFLDFSLTHCVIAVVCHELARPNLASDGCNGGPNGFMHIYIDGFNSTFFHKFRLHKIVHYLYPQCVKWPSWNEGRSSAMPSLPGFHHRGQGGQGVCMWC